MKKHKQCTKMLGALVYPNAYANAYTYANADAYANANADADAYAYANADAYAYAYANVYAIAKPLPKDFKDKILNMALIKFNLQYNMKGKEISR